MIKIDSEFCEINNLRIELKKIYFCKFNSLEPIILLHEGLGSVDLWKEWPIKLSEASKRNVILYSREGMGNSSSIKNGSM